MSENIISHKLDRIFGIPSPMLFSIVLTVGVLVRYLCSLGSSNFDFASWEIVSNFYLEDKLVYISTKRYNYGPIWFHVLGFLQWIGDLRLDLMLFLTLVDVLIFFMIWKLGYKKESILFFLCPISFVISGQHHQFENFAMLPIVFAVFLMVKKYHENVAFKELKWLDILILSLALGFSLMIKHIFILLPIWFFFQSHDFFKRVVILLLPIGLFFLSFVPYWAEGKVGIMANVFNYTSNNNFPLYQVFYYDIFYYIHRINLKYMRYIFMFTVIVLGFAFRRKSLLDTFLFYTGCFVCFSSAIANQYLVIPVLFVAFNFYTAGLVYFVVGAVALICFDLDGLHLFSTIWPFSIFVKSYWYKFILLFLFINLISAAYKKDYLWIILIKWAEVCKKLVLDGVEEILVFVGIKKLNRKEE